MTILLEYGVDPNIRDANGKLAISYLSDDKSKNLIRTFLKAKEIKGEMKTILRACLYV
jgi:ankyrin repeat protein